MPELEKPNSDRALPRRDRSRTEGDLEAELREWNQAARLVKIGQDLVGVSDREELLERAAWHLKTDLSYRRAFILLDGDREKSKAASGHAAIIPVQWNREKFGNIVVPLDGAVTVSARDYEMLEAFSSFLAVGLSNIRRLDEIRLLASTDSLTGILNRRKLLEVGAQALSRKDSTAAIVFDIDSFKAVNDTHGHAAGDALILSIVRIAKECIRKTDLLGRYGGDEFVILLPRADVRCAQQIAKRIRAKVHDSAVEVGGEYISCTISAGVACVDGEADLSQLIDQADKALYTAKRVGGNTVCWQAAPATTRRAMTTMTVSARAM